MKHWCFGVKKKGHHGRFGLSVCYSMPSTCTSGDNPHQFVITVDGTRLLTDSQTPGSHAKRIVTDDVNIFEIFHLTHGRPSANRTSGTAGTLGKTPGPTHFINPHCCDHSYRMY